MIAARPAAERNVAAWLEAGLDATAFLFLPVLALASRGLAPLEGAAGLLALGVLSQRSGPAPRTLAVAATLSGTLVLWGGLSAAWSPDAARSLVLALHLAGLCAAGLALVAVPPAFAAPERLRRAFLAGLAVAIALLAVERSTGGLLTQPFSRHPFNPAALNQASDTLAILVWPAAAALLLSGQRGLAIVLLAAVAATIFGLVGTDAKLSFAAGLAGALAFFYGRRVLPPLAALLSALLVVTAPLTLPRLAAIGPVMTVAVHLKSSVSHRLLIWSFVGHRIAERPFIGWGLDASRAIPGGGEWIQPTQPWLPLHPHDAPLQLWLELGVPGAAIGALVLGGLWLGLARLALPRLFAAACAGALVAAMSELFATYGLWEEWWLGTLWFCLFLVLVMARLARVRRTSRAP